MKAGCETLFIISLPPELNFNRNRLGLDSKMTH